LSAGRPDRKLGRKEEGKRKERKEPLEDSQDADVDGVGDEVEVVELRGRRGRDGVETTSEHSSELGWEGEQEGIGKVAGEGGVLLGGR
jgi:hypothetical protein